MFQHTAARRRLAGVNCKNKLNKKFQHTAARRRLDALAELRHYPIGFNTQPPEGGWVAVSAMSAPVMAIGFNTQPPEGGWQKGNTCHKRLFLFQHTAARRRLGRTVRFRAFRQGGFNTQPPEGGWLTSIRRGC